MTGSDLESSQHGGAQKDWIDNRRDPGPLIKKIVGRSPGSLQESSSNVVSDPSRYKNEATRIVSGQKMHSRQATFFGLLRFIDFGVFRQESVASMALSSCGPSAGLAYKYTPQNALQSAACRI